jgi:hypothetical protein
LHSDAVCRTLADAGEQGTPGSGWKAADVGAIQIDIEISNAELDADAEYPEVL